MEFEGQKRFFLESNSWNDNLHASAESQTLERPLYFLPHYSSLILHQDGQDCVRICASLRNVARLRQKRQVY